MNPIKDLWWRVWCVQALLGGVAAVAQMRLVEREKLAVVIFLWVLRAGQVGAAALGAPSTTTATWGVAEPGDGARWNSLVVWVRKVIWKKKKEIKSEYRMSNTVSTFYSLVKAKVISWQQNHFTENMISTGKLLQVLNQCYKTVPLVPSRPSTYQHCKC